jgi:hypothetical protein
VSETGWLSILSPLVAATIAAIAYLWKQRDKIYETQIEKLETEIAAGRLKVTELQDKALLALQLQLDEAKKRAETDQRIATSIEQQTATLKAMASLKP